MGAHMQPNIPLPEEMIPRDPRVRIKTAIKHFLMIPRVHRVLGYGVTTALFQFLRLGAL